MDVKKFQALEKVDVAKRMVANNDYVGARSKLLELHYQFPSLGNVPPMITACEVLCASELTFLDGQSDCYWVLQLSPMASMPQIRLQHKKLVTILEGTIKEFPGAITALKLVHDAFFILSNPPKRLVFDSKRLTSLSDCEPIVSPVSSVDNTGSHSSKGLAQEQDTLGCESSVSKKTDATNVIGDVDEKGSKVIELDGEAHNFDDLLNNGVCSLEVNSISSLKSMPNNNGRNYENTLSSAIHPGLYDVGSNSKDKNFEVGQIWAASDDENLPRRYARINSISESPFSLALTWLRPVPENDDEEKWCEAGLPVVCGLFNLDGDEESVVDYSIFSHWVSYTANPTYDEFRIHPQEDEVWAVYEPWKPFEWCDNPESRKGCGFQIVHIMYLKEEEECVLVVEPIKESQERFEIPSSCFYRFSHRLPSYELKEIESGSTYFGSLEPDIPQSFQSLPPLPVSNGRSSLKADWTARDFTQGQVWAIYDGNDQMPRRYVVVNNSMSNTIVSVNLLDPKPRADEEICWVEEKLPLGCGFFEVNPTIVTIQMSKFSHLVNCDRSPRQFFYRIYPRKGEVWAMHDLNPKQDFYHAGCQIVQITSDFCEQSGVQVACLEQVPGYKTFFQKRLCDGFALNKAVRRTEMHSFSHRVEAYVVPGIQAHGIPECSWHLEPDALPLVLSN